MGLPLKSFLANTRASRNPYLDILKWIICLSSSFTYNLSQDLPA